MSCPICTNPFNDHVAERRCYNICETDGYAVCHECMMSMVARAAGRPTCPGCRGLMRTNPVFTRINNDEADDDSEDADGPATPMVLDDADARPARGDKIVMLIDVSGSMNNPSGQLKGDPTRLELAGHMAKVMRRFCGKLGLKCVIHTFSDGVKKLDVDETTTVDSANRAIENTEPSGQTFIGLALRNIFQTHGPTAKYFVFTDGEPSDEFDDALRDYQNTQLHLLAFSKDVSTKLLMAVADNPLHTISYIKDIQSLPGYMVPIFIWAVLQPSGVAGAPMQTVTLDERDEELRRQFVQMLEPQVRGDASKYKLFDLVNLVARFNAAPGGATDYSRDLAMDIAGTEAHSRIEYSFKKENWLNFGRFYLICIAHCHKHLIPGNAFDPSLKRYRPLGYSEVFAQIADIPMDVPFVAYMTRHSEAARAAASASASVSVASSYRYVDSYPSSSASDEGCIGADELVSVYKHGFASAVPIQIPMKHVMPGDVLDYQNSKAKWIIRISNLNNGKPVALHNGLTRSHPVCVNGHWINAADYQPAAATSKMTFTTGRVYDVILDNLDAASMKVNGIDVAVAGYPVPGMVHPYWGSQKVIQDVQARYPDGGFVDVDAAHFQHTDGLVSSLFAD